MRLSRFRHLLIAALALLTVAAWPANADAQYRRRVHRHVIVRGVYGPVFVRPWYPRVPWLGYQYGYPYPPYFPAYVDMTSAIRLEVTPRETEVYVDGYRAGTVDDFDGVFQRLRVRPGEHEITLYLDGYRVERQQLYLSARGDVKIRHTMVPLTAGEAQEPRPNPPAQPPAGPPDDELPPPVPGRLEPSRPGEPPPMPPPDSGPAANFGALSIRVQPPGAEVLVDGQPWSDADARDRLVVQVAAGRHRLEIRQDGYAPYERDIDVRPGETVTLNISLTQQ